jgi:hypothetical protein
MDLAKTKIHGKMDTDRSARPKSFTNKTIERSRRSIKMTDVDIFDGIQTTDSAETAPGVSPDDVNVTESATEPSDEASERSEGAESPVETVATVPVGAMSITEFAAYMTQTLMKATFEAGEELDMSQYVVPQAVYQTVKAQRDRIPHVIVKGADDTEGRVYILKDEATAWWLNRKERLANRGAGSQRASSRSPEENLTLLSVAVAKSLYARDRLAMWTSRVEQSDKLVEKYQGFLKDAEVSEETVNLTVQEATDQYNTEKAQKEAEKAAKAKKSGKTGTESETADEE